MAEIKINELNIGAKVTGIKLKNTEGFLHPETDIKRVQGLQELVTALEGTITASQNAATTKVAQGTGIVVSSSTATGGDGSTTYTVALGTTLAGASALGIYKVAVDTYGRITEVSTPTAEEVLALNGSVTEKTKLIASKKEVEDALAAAKKALSKVAVGTGVALGTATDGDGSTTYTVYLTDVLTGGAKSEGLYKTAINAQGRVTSAAAPTQADIIALATSANDENNIATKKDIKNLGNEIESIQSLASQALHFQKVIDTTQPLSLTDAKLAEIKGSALDNGDVFVIGNIGSNAVTVGTAALEQGDTIIVQKVGNSTITLHTVQANIDGAVTATDELTSQGIVVGKGGHTVETQSAASLGLVQAENFKAANKLVVTSDNADRIEVKESDIDIANVVTSSVAAGTGVALVNGTSIVSALSGTNGQVLGIKDGKIEFVGATTKVSLTGDAQKFELRTGASDADSATTVVATINVGTGDENINVSLQSGTFAITHKTAGAAKTAVTSAGTTANGGKISVPSISIDANGHVVSLSTSEIDTPKFGVGTGLSLDGTNFYLSGVTRTDGTDTAATKNLGDTFTIVSGVETNATGQVTKVKTQSVTLGNPDLEKVKVGTLANDADYVKIVGADAAGTGKTVTISNIQIGSNTIKFGETLLTGTYYGGTAASVAHSITVANQTFNGSENVTISAGTGISFANNDIALGTVLDFGKTNGTVNLSTTLLGTAVLDNGGPLVLPKIDVDIYGRVTSVDTQEINLPKLTVSVSGIDYSVPYDGNNGAMKIPFGTGIVVDNASGALCADLQYAVIND